jgi:hypothetical protein
VAALSDDGVTLRSTAHGTLGWFITATYGAASGTESVVRMGTELVRTM